MVSRLQTACPMSRFETLGTVAIHLAVFEVVAQCEANCRRFSVGASMAQWWKARSGHKALVLR